MSAVAADAAAKAVGRNRTKHRARRRWVGTASLIVLGLLFALIVIAVKFGGYQIRPVLSGSMRPGLAVGGVVVTRQVPLQDVKVRDVVVFHRPDQPSELVVHRIISLARTGSTVTVKTQGDANSTRDPWTITLRGSTAYRAVFSLPLLGYPAVWMHSPDGQRELMAFVGLLIAIVALGMWRKERRPGSAADSEPDARLGDETTPECSDLLATQIDRGESAARSRNVVAFDRIANVADPEGEPAGARLAFVHRPSPYRSGC